MKICGGARPRVPFWEPCQSAMVKRRVAPSGRCKDGDVMKSRSSRRWAIKVRLADGSELSYAPDAGRSGQAAWSPRVNQARPFDSDAEASRVAAGFLNNSAAREYKVVPLSG